MEAENGDFRPMTILDDCTDFFHERAAIREFDGGETRMNAEIRAKLQLRREHERRIPGTDYQTGRSMFVNQIYERNRV